MQALLNIETKAQVIIIQYKNLSTQALMLLRFRGKVFNAFFSS